MNRTQNKNMMKALKHISVLLIVACAPLSSCLLLAPSPLYSSDSLSYFDDEEEIITQNTVDIGWNNDVYSEVFQIPVDGGSIEFDCGYDQFYISKIFDSSLPCTFDSFSTQVFRPVNAWVYNGPFYTITCDTHMHTWKIEVKPLILTSEVRQIWVLMWPGFDEYNYVFQFEQGDSDMKYRNG
jgi:hypothetical protein